MTETSKAVVDQPSERRTGRAIGGGLIAVVLLVALYYVGGMIWLHTISDDTGFMAADMEETAGSRSVAIAAALIGRETDTNRWVANDPVVQPGHLLDNMPNFQTGLIQALSRYAFELMEQIARVRGSSQIDADAESAAGRLKYPGDVWIFEWSSTPVQPSSESQYRKAREDLLSYNERLANGQARFEPRADNLLATLDSVASDMGSSSAALAQKIKESEDLWLDLNADDLFYNNKGRLYAYYMLLREIRADFGGIIQERNLSQSWDGLMASLKQAAELQPWVVINGTLGSQFKPNHLAAQGFLLLRARTQLREITNILLK